MSSQSSNSLTTDEIVLKHLRMGIISIDHEGRVWRYAKLFRSGQIARYPKPRRIDLKDSGGYHGVKLGWQGRRVQSSAHRIQWIANHGIIPVDLEVNHKDLDKSNNAIGNLELLSHAENLQHARNNKENWSRFGENHAQSKLTEAAVKEIREKCGSGESTQAEMAKKHKVSQPMISQLIHNKRWRKERYA